MRTMTSKHSFWLWAIPALCVAGEAAADYRTDIGYAALQASLGVDIPTGAGINVVQVEAPTGIDANGKAIFAPDGSQSQFSGKTISVPVPGSPTASGHATGVAGLFYGQSAVANGIGTITAYQVNDWIPTLYNPSNGRATAPVNGSRIANHSWVGNGNTPADTAAILRLVDRQVVRNEYIQVVGMANGASDDALLGGAYNTIAVGRTDGHHDYGSDAVDSSYVAGRTRPDLVAPQSTTSAATPLVSAAAALLVETGHHGAASLSDDSTNVGGVGTVYDAERSETIKAALMAGADRFTSNTSTSANITDYRSAGHQTLNGLDDRFGAGQLNVFNSYRIIAAGERNSVEDGGSANIGYFGFDYDAAFGGSAGSNATASYHFVADADLQMAVSLVWNLGVSNDSAMTTRLHNLDLELFDVTSQSTAAYSDSDVDNSENLWVSLINGHSYRLQVKSGESGNFSWDYSLAWRMSAVAAPVPLPGAVYLFASAMAGLAWGARRKS